MDSLLDIVRLAEVVMLAFSGLAAWSLRYSGKRTIATTLLVAFFLAIYVVKLTALPAARFPVDAPFRPLYLGLLLIHAATVPVAVVAGLIALAKTSHRRPDVAAKWRARFGRAWTVASAAGVAAYAIFEAGT